MYVECLKFERNYASYVLLTCYVQFAVSRKGAGFAELDVAVTSPLGQDLPIQVKSGPDRESDLIEFTPTLPGNYKFKITYGGDEIPGETNCPS